MTRTSMKSVIMNRPHFSPPYSAKKPMISDSPSGRSKGTRLVSARAAMKKTRKPSGCRNTPQRGRKPRMVPAWKATISDKRRLGKTIISPTRESPSAAS